MLQAEFIGELLGTMTLIIFGSGVVASTLLNKSKGQSGGWMAITTGWAMGVFIGVFVAQSTGSSQADINPAISLAKYVMGIAYFAPHELLTAISDGLTELHELATEANKQLTIQAAMLEQVDDKMDKTIKSFKSANQRLKSMLDESGGMSRWCPIMIITIVLLACIGYIFGIV